MAEHDQRTSLERVVSHVRLRVCTDRYGNRSVLGWTGMRTGQADPLLASLLPADEREHVTFSDMTIEVPDA